MSSFVERSLFLTAPPLSSKSWLSFFFSSLAFCALEAAAPLFFFNGASSSSLLELVEYEL
eukprot:CAMPEP_0198534496 /NCGR_PEP_ID=MMETSP1462-20131121/36480_1 /TAXON_ID=1333877 /ORGANISM="Brandtodinium nutriculum, Strain RCC3387" /LENGTH=59 /DNA_ID=CAMNT_0044264419 /DNA_START=447 /DNA_END=626 /DNA_ORIENTATION=+